MRWWSWWRKKPLEESKPEPLKRPSPKTRVTVWLRHASWPNNYLTLDYTESADLLSTSYFGINKDGWIEWPADRDGEKYKVPVENVLLVRMATPREVS